MTGIHEIMPHEEIDIGLVMRVQLQFPHPATVCHYAQKPRWLVQAHIKDGTPGQAGTEGFPGRTAIGRAKNPDIRSDVYRISQSRVDHHNIDRNVG